MFLMKLIKVLAFSLSCFFLSVSAESVSTQDIEVFSNDVSISSDKKTYTYIGNVEIHFDQSALMNSSSKLVKYEKDKVKMSGDVVVTFVSGEAYAEELTINQKGDKVIASTNQLVFRLSPKNDEDTPEI
jgi:lipopolysaccharide export system protein LptA